MTVYTITSLPFDQARASQVCAGRRSKGDGGIT